MDDCLVCQGIPDSHPYRVASTKCRIDTVISPDDGHIVARKDVEKRNKQTKKNCAQSWLCLQDYTGMHSQQNIEKNVECVFQVLVVVSI